MATDPVPSGESALALCCICEGGDVVTAGGSVLYDSGNPCPACTARAELARLRADLVERTEQLRLANVDALQCEARANDAEAEAARYREALEREETVPESIRRPVGIAAMQDTDFVQGATYVICTDGSCWYMDKGGWSEYPPIPGTPADDARNGADRA